MPVTASDLRVSIRGTINDINWQNIQWYRLTGAAFLTATLDGVAEAFWDDIKTAFRAIMPDDGAVRIMSLFLQEPGLTGAYAEYAIPTGEQLGTRVVTSLGGTMPQFNAGGIRLVVGTRVTRPGQKRIVGMREGDQDSGVLNSGYLTKLEDVALIFSSTRTLGAPVATGTMDPEIVRYDDVTGTITFKQDVTGHLLNERVTSQVSRKYGHGS